MQLRQKPVVRSSLADFSQRTWLSLA